MVDNNNLINGKVYFCTFQENPVGMIFLKDDNFGSVSKPIHYFNKCDNIGYHYAAALNAYNLNLKIREATQEEINLLQYHMKENGYKLDTENLIDIILW